MTLASVGADDGGVSAESTLGNLERLLKPSYYCCPVNAHNGTGGFLNLSIVQMLPGSDPDNSGELLFCPLEGEGKAFSL